jgi:hypothetical protein
MIMKKRIGIGCLIAAALGVLLGYLGAFVEFGNERDHGASYSQWRGEAFVLPAMPGMIATAKLRPYDYQLTERWLADKHLVALMNGVIYLPFGLLGLIGRRKGIQAASRDMPCKLGNPER